MPGQETRRERREKNGTFGREDRRTGNKEVKSPSPETAPTLGERAKKIPTDKGWDFSDWWSRRESNPRPRVFCDQFYVCSDVIEISLPLRRRTGSTSNQPPEF